MFQVQIMKLMDHPNIIRFYQVVENYQYIHLVSSFAENGELYGNIQLLLLSQILGKNNILNSFINILLIIIHYNQLCSKKTCPESTQPTNQNFHDCILQNTLWTEGASARRKQGNISHRPAVRSSTAMTKASCIETSRWLLFVNTRKYFTFYI